MWGRSAERKENAQHEWNRWDGKHARHYSERFCIMYLCLCATFFFGGVYCYATLFCSCLVPDFSNWVAYDISAVKSNMPLIFPHMHQDWASLSWFMLVININKLCKNYCVNVFSLGLTGPKKLRNHIATCFGIKTIDKGDSIRRGSPSPSQVWNSGAGPHGLRSTYSIE